MVLALRRRVLWKLRRARQLIRCEVRAHPFGIELRYLVNGKPLVSRVFEEWDALETVAGSWHEGLRLRGWRAEFTTHGQYSAAS